MIKCFWCGESAGIGIPERIDEWGDDTSYSEKVISYEPCSKCQEGMDKGFTVMEASIEPLSKNQPAIDKERGIYPTGNMWVIDNEAAEKIFGKENVEQSKIFIEVGVAEKMGLIPQNK